MPSYEYAYRRGEHLRRFGTRKSWGDAIAADVVAGETVVPEFRGHAMPTIGPFELEQVRRKRMDPSTTMEELQDGYTLESMFLWPELEKIKDVAWPEEDKKPVGRPAGGGIRQRLVAERIEAGCMTGEDYDTIARDVVRIARHGH